MSEAIPQIKAFVIGPIGDKDAAHDSISRKAYEDGIQALEEIIEPACKALEISVLRADQISTTGEIPEQIFKCVRDSHIVIADLTGANPNVMYELGLRHTTGKLTIQIGEKDRLPFDVSSIRTIMFRRTASGIVEARRRLIETLASGLVSGGDPVTATRVWFEKNDSRDSGYSEAESPDINQEEPGFLEKIAETEDGIISIGQNLEVITTIFDEISQTVSADSPKMAAANNSPNSSSMKVLIADSLAAKLQPIAEKLHIAVTAFAASVDKSEPGMLYILGELASDPQQAKEAQGFVDGMRQIVVSAQESISGVQEFKSALSISGNATRMMSRVSKNLHTSLDTYCRSSLRVAKWNEFVEKIKS